MCQKKLVECDDFIKMTIGCNFGMFRYAPWNALIRRWFGSAEDNDGEGSVGSEGGTGQGIMVSTDAGTMTHARMAGARPTAMPTSEKDTTSPITLKRKGKGKETEATANACGPKISNAGIGC